MQYYRLAVEANVPEAAVRLGIMLDEGRGGETNHTEAVRYYRMASKSGNAEGQFCLAMSLTWGEGVIQDFGEALVHLREAADQGNGPAVFQIGVAYLRGRGVATDLIEASRWFRKAEAMGITEARFALGSIYLSRESGIFNWSEAKHWLELAAADGHTKAMSTLGGALFYGSYEPADPNAGLKLIRTAAGKGDPVGMAILGQACALGLSTPTNYTEAIHWLEPAAAAGEDSARNNLGVLLEDHGTGQDMNRSHRLIQDAADDGYAPAMNNLGRHHLHGIGTPVDKEKALYWYRRAAEKGATDGLFQLGMRLCDGSLGETNLTEGRHYLSVAAHHGDINAMRQVALACFNGTWLAKDPARGNYWLHQASREGNTNRFLAIDYGEELLAQLPMDLIAVSGGPAEGRRLLGLAMKTFNNGPNSTSESVACSYLEQSAALGLAVSQCLLGEALMKGHHCHQDPNRGRESLRKSAVQGFPPAMYKVALFLEEDDRNANSEEIMSLTRESASGGYAPAQFRLANELIRLRSDRESFKEATHWMIASASQGHPPAVRAIAFSYRKEPSLALSEAVKAGKLLRAAAELGDAPAQMTLGNDLLQSVVEDNGAEGVQWLRRAAAQGLLPAQMALGEALVTGTGTTKDETEGLKWLLIAGRNVARGRNEADAIRKRMKPADASEAERQAGNFSPQISSVGEIWPNTVAPEIVALIAP